MKVKTVKGIITICINLHQKTSHGPFFGEQCLWGRECCRRDQCPGIPGAMWKTMLKNAKNAGLSWSFHIYVSLQEATDHKESLMIKWDEHICHINHDSGTHETSWNYRSCKFQEDQHQGSSQTFSWECTCTRNCPEFMVSISTFNFTCAPVYLLEPGPRESPLKPERLNSRDGYPTKTWDSNRKGLPQW